MHTLIVGTNTIIFGSSRVAHLQYTSDDSLIERCDEHEPAPSSTPCMPHLSLHRVEAPHAARCMDLRACRPMQISIHCERGQYSDTHTAMMVKAMAISCRVLGDRPALLFVDATPAIPATQRCLTTLHCD